MLFTSRQSAKRKAVFGAELNRRDFAWDGGIRQGCTRGRRAAIHQAQAIETRRVAKQTQLIWKWKKAAAQAQKVGDTPDTANKTSRLYTGLRWEWAKAANQAQISNASGVGNETGCKAALTGCKAGRGETFCGKCECKWSMAGCLARLGKKQATLGQHPEWFGCTVHSRGSFYSVADTCVAQEAKDAV